MRTLAVLGTFTLLLVLAGGGHLLTRLDRIAAEQRATDARVRYAQARIELVRAVIAHHDVKPPTDPRVDVCVRRTDALRSAIFALVRTGNASMTGTPEWEWIAWQ
jgi:hypothetical protein